MKKYTINKDLKDRQEQSWEQFRDSYLEEFIEDRMPDIENQLEDIQKEFRTKANTAFDKFVNKKINIFVKECKEKGEIWEKNSYPFNKMWIVNDEGIKKTLKRYPKLLDVINFIDGEGKHDESIDAKDFISFKVKTKLGIETRKYSHVIVDKDFYVRVKKTIGIEKITMQKYLQALRALHNYPKIDFL